MYNELIEINQDKKMTYIQIAELLKKREVSYDKTLAKLEVYSQKAIDYKLSVAEDAEYVKLSNILEKKHELVMKCLRQLNVKSLDVYPL